MLSRIISKSRILRTLTTKAAPPAVTADNNTEVDDTKPPGDRGWTKGEFHSVEDTLNKHIPPKELEEVKRVLYGLVSLLFFFDLQLLRTSSLNFYYFCLFFFTISMIFRPLFFFFNFRIKENSSKTSTFHRQHKKLQMNTTLTLICLSSRVQSMIPDHHA